MKIKKRYIFIVIFILSAGAAAVFFTGCKPIDEHQALLDQKRIENSPYTKYVKGVGGHSVSRTSSGVFVYQDNTVYNNTNRTIILPKRTKTQGFGPRTVKFGPE